MASKLDRLKTRLKNMTEGTKRVGLNVLHSGETLVVGSGVAYAEGRLSDDNGEWGYRGIPFAYAGGAVLFLTGLYASFKESDYGADLMAMGTGAVGAHLFRGMYESGLDAKANRTTGQRRQVPMRNQPRGLGQKMQSAAGVGNMGTVFDRVQGAAK